MRGASVFRGDDGPTSAPLRGGGGGSYGTFAVGGNVRAAFNIPIARAAHSHRYAISISADFTPAWATPLRDTTLPAGFQFGFMGGVGFELY